MRKTGVVQWEKDERTTQKTTLEPSHTPNRKIYTSRHIYIYICKKVYANPL